MLALTIVSRIPALVGQMKDWNGMDQACCSLAGNGINSGAVKNVEMRTLCQIVDTCPEVREVLLSLLADLPLKIHS
jgi:hypothetical protein